MDCSIVFRAASARRTGFDTASALAAQARRMRNHMPSQQISQGRTVGAAGIASALVFPASEQARYITGQMLCIDGGSLAKRLSWDAAL